MSKIIEKKLLDFVVSSIIEATDIPQDFVSLALEYTNLEFASDEAIDEAAAGYDPDSNETTLRIQEIDDDGNIVDEYELPPYEEENEDEPSVHDKLLDLARKARLMKAIGDHNYRKMHELAVELIACQHSGYVVEDEVLDLPGPLTDYIPHDRKDKLWEEFCKEHDIDPNYDEHQLEGITDE